MTRALKKTSALELLREANHHFVEGSRIWNSIGIDNPHYIKPAARAALEEYRKSDALLRSGDFSLLSSKTQEQVLITREIVLAQIASTESFLYDEQSDEGIEQSIESVQTEVKHWRRALKLAESSKGNDAEQLSSWRASLLHSEGREATLLARLASRNGRLDEARVFYSNAEGKFQQLMNTHEAQTPELASIAVEVEGALEQKRKEIHQDSRTEDEEKDKVWWRSRVLYISDETPPLPNEDLYRRTAANYYASAAMRAHLDAFKILNEGGLPRDAEKKLEESIERIYSAMEIFPQNLEYHQDLFNVWRVRGELFGCPMEETQDYYHTWCPLAIMHHTGSWYVSPTLEYEALTCTVCGKDILECPHYPGDIIDGTVVRYEPQNIKMISTSLVDVPEDPRCRQEWISIPKSYFPPPLEDGAILRCRLCQIERDEGRVDARLIALPDWVEAELERRNERIRHSKRFRIIDKANEETRSEHL